MKKNSKIVIDESKLFTSPNSISYKDIGGKKSKGVSLEYVKNYIAKHRKKPQSSF